MKVFVTGGTGFVGKHFIRALVRDGHDVVCYVRRASRHYLEGVTYDTSLVHVRSSDIVYHLAGVLGRRGLPIEVYTQAHVRLPQRILRLMSRRQLFVYMSSCWVLNPNKAYEVTKLEGEQAVKDSGIPYRIVRPGFIYGPGDLHHHRLFKWIKQLGPCFPISSNGPISLCPTYVGDVVKTLLVAPQLEEVTHVAGAPVTLEHFIALVSKELGVSAPRLRVPPALVRLLTRTDFLTTSRVFPSDITAIPLATGLNETICWYRNNRLL